MSIERENPADQPDQNDLLQKEPFVNTEDHKDGADQLSFSMFNSRSCPAYVRLLDYDFHKDYVFIDSPFFDDPTIGHRPRYAHGAPMPWRSGPVEIIQVFLWSPMMRSQLDLFTLHFYEAGAEPDEFSDLRILFPRYAPDWANPDLAIFELIDRPIALTDRTRISFLLPACAKACIDLYHRPIS